MAGGARAFLILALPALLSLAPAGAAPTEVMFFFDAEDYTSDRPNDALRDLCNLFHEEGATAHVALVGYLAHEIARYGRKDVVEALRHHVVGTQSMYHSLHPNVLELSDEADYARAYEAVMRQEREAFTLIRRLTGRDPLFAVPPGASKSYVAMDVYADLGIKYYCDTVCAHDAAGGDEFLNLRHFPYSDTFWLEALIPGQEGEFAGEAALGIDWAKALDAVASRPRQLLFLHPCMAVNAEFWDAVNYMKGNNCTFGKWNIPKRRAPEDTAKYYARLRELIRRLKADGRFTFPTLAEKAKAEPPRRALRRADLPRLDAHMARKIDADREGGWSVADVFQAAVMFLRGADEHKPGKVYGFLERPFAVERATTLKTADLRAAAEALDLRRHLPASIAVGGVKIGPGDFLRAALHALATGADEVSVEPSDPLAALRGLPQLEAFHPAGTWVFWPEFKDAFASERLRLQVWTWRPGVCQK